MEIPVGYGQLTFFFSGSGVPLGAACTLGYRLDAPNFVPQQANDAKAAFESNILPVLVQNTGLDYVLAKQGPQSTGASATSASGVGGGDLSAQAPPNVTYLVRKVTDAGGRKNRGRFYLPGVDETEVLQGGTVSGTKLTALQTALDGFYDDLVAADMTPVILHNSASAPTVISSFSVQSTVATQRRRLRR